MQRPKTKSIIPRKFLIFLSAASRATKIIVKAINDSITNWLIVTIPKNDRDKVIL
jgi:hypothetical protein